MISLLEYEMEVADACGNTMSAYFKDLDETIFTIRKDEYQDFVDWYWDDCYEQSIQIMIYNDDELVCRIDYDCESSLLEYENWKMENLDNLFLYLNDVLPKYERNLPYDKDVSFPSPCAGMLWMDIDNANEDWEEYEDYCENREWYKETEI